MEAATSSHKQKEKPIIPTLVGEVGPVGSAEALVLVELIDGLHLVGREGEVEDGKVGGEMIGRGSFGDGGDVVLDEPAQKHLSGGLDVVLCDGGEYRVLQKRAFAEGAIGDEGDVVLLAEDEKFVLVEVGMELDLVGGDGNACVESVLEVVDGEVADADGADMLGF